MSKRNISSLSKALVTWALLLVTMPIFAQTKVQRGVARMITRSLNDPVVPVAGVQVVVGNVANKASDKNGRFSMTIAVNNEQSYSLTDVRLPKGSKLMLASPSKKKKLFLDNNDLEVSLISKDEKDMVSKANYDKLRERYKAQTGKVFKLRNQLDEKMAELNESSKEYSIVKAKRDSVQNLLSLYYDDKIYEQTLKDLQTIAEDLALTDYQSLDSIEARIYNLKMEGDWQTISDVLIRLMGGNASAWLHAKLERRNQAAKDFAMGMEMIKEAIEAFKMQHLNDSVSRYYEILIKADSTNWDNLNDAGLWELEYMAHYDKALQYYLKALPSAESDTLKATCYNNIGGVYENKYMRVYGEELKALEYYQKALTIWKSVFGENNPNVATSYNNIGGIYLDLVENAKSLEYYQKALEISILCNDFYGIARSYNNIGAVYFSMDNYRKALENHKKGLDIALSVIGENNPKVATLYFNIGDDYSSLGKYVEALEYHQKALKIRETVLNENNPEIAISYMGMGTLYISLKKYTEAHECYQKALGIRKFIYGENHQYVAAAYDQIGISLKSQGEYSLALDSYLMALKIQKSIDSAIPSDIAASLYNIGNVYEAQHIDTLALDYYEQALPLSQSNCGKIYRAMARLYANRGAYDKSLDCLQRSVSMSMGKNQAEVAKAYNNIGNLYGIQGNDSIALEYFYKALNVLNDSLQVEEEIYKSNVFQSIGNLYKRRYNNVKASEYYEKALDIQKNVYGETSPQLIVSYENLANLYDNMEEYAKALDKNQKLLEIHKEQLGEESNEVASDYIRIGVDYIFMGDKANALTAYRQALKIKEKLLGDQHYEVTSLQNSINNLKRSINQTE